MWNEALIEPIISLTCKLEANGGSVELSFEDGSGCLLIGSGGTGPISQITNTRGKRGNLANDWLTFYFSTRNHDEKWAFMQLLNEVVHPFITKLYEN